MPGISSHLFGDFQVFAQMWAVVAVKGLALLTAASLLSLALRRASAATRHLLWSTALVALLLLPLLVARLPERSLPLRAPAFLEPLTESFLAAERDPVPLLEIAVGPSTTPDVATDRSRRPEGASGDPGALHGQAPATLDPARTIREPAAAQPAPARAMREPAPAQPATATGPPSAGAEEQSAQPGFVALVLLVWLAGVVLLGGWFLLQHGSARWLAQKARPLPVGRRYDLVQQLQRQIGLRRTVRLLESEGAAMPMTWGIRRPVLLLPSEASDWPAGRQRDVTLHELAHIKRLDQLTQLLSQAACALHWFNPLVWYAARRLGLESEHACDDYVLRQGTRPSDYAESLLEVARSLRRSPVTAAAAIAMARRSTLRERLTAVLDAKRQRSRTGRLALCATCGVMAAVALPLAALRLTPVQAAPPEGDAWERHQAVVVPPGQIVVVDGVHVLVLPDAREGRAYALIDAKTLERMRALAPAQRSRLEKLGGFSIETLKLRPGEPFVLADVDAHRARELVLLLEELGLAPKDDSRALLSTRVNVPRRDLLRLAPPPRLAPAPSVTVSTALQLSPAPSVLVAPAPRAVRAPVVTVAPKPVFVPAPSVSVTAPVAVPAPTITVEASVAPDLVFAKASSTRSQSINGHWELVHEGDDGPRVRARAHGDIVFNDEATDVESISRGGSLDIRVDGDGDPYRIKLEGERDGKVVRRYWVDGKEQPYDDEAGKRLVTALDLVLRESGVQAGARVEKLLEQGGVQKVLDEVEKIDSDHVQGVYLDELQQQADLDAKEMVQLYAAASRQIRSDFELASLLVKSVERRDLDEAACSAYAKASTSIGSDFEQSRALRALVQTQPLPGKALQDVLDAAADVGSDFELAQLLVSTLKEHRIDAGSEAAFLAAMESLGSDFEFRRAAQAAVERRSLDDAGMARLLRLAGHSVNSDFELAELLTSVADTYTVEGELREAYLDASDSIASSHENRRALAALVRR